MLLPIATVRRWYHALSSNHLSDVMRPILLPLTSVNQRLPSGPAAISLRKLGTGNSVMVPLGLMRPILLAACSVNQGWPCGAKVMRVGLRAPRGTQKMGRGNSGMVPLGLMRTILVD